MSARPAIPWRDNQLVRPGRPDGRDGRLVVLDDEFGRHVVWLVHQAENHFLVVFEAAREFPPKGSELCSCGGCVVGNVADDRSGEGLRGWISVAHVVMRVEDGIGAFFEGNVVDGLFVVVKVLERGLVECVKGQKGYMAKG
jgi:hypothetical protein